MIGLLHAVGGVRVPGPPLIDVALLGLASREVGALRPAGGLFDGSDENRIISLGFMFVGGTLIASRDDAADKGGVMALRAGECFADEAREPWREPPSCDGTRDAGSETGSKHPL